jgi:hypothetical protein
VPVRAHPDDQPRLLADVLARARAGAPAGVVVFDLDSTILDNRPRQARILQDYGREAGLVALLDARPEHWVGWDIEAAMLRAGLSPEEARAHARPARRFWAAWFFTSAYCRLDVPVPGAPAYVEAVRRAGARIAYVTGRPARMRDGTLHVFRRAGFPPPDGARVLLLMKEDAALGDDEWKARACADVDALGPVLAAFDNEPAHVNLYAERWPEARCVHLDREHSSRPIEVLARIPSVLDFRLAPLTAAATGATPGAP